MQVMPDAVGAARDQAAVIRVVQAALGRTLARLSLGATSPAPGWLRVDGAGLIGAAIDVEVGYPGSVAVTYAAQHAARQGPTAADRERLAAEVVQRLAEVAEQGQASARRGLASRCPAWRLDLTPPQWHLSESCVRALGQTPQIAGVRGHADVVDWTEADREVFCSASCFLADVWPQMLAEMATTVRQLCLVHGDGLGGFTDFVTHGSVFVDRRRLRPGAAGLPTGVRLAETLVHEATHHRCNAAAVSGPFLTQDTGIAPLVNTPLRPDPRPLSGLFQQLVVLVRCQLLYARLIEGAGLDGEALLGRRQRLTNQARQALATVRNHSAALTEHGRDVVTEAEEILRGAVVTGSPR